ncbi:MAG: peptidylprolyl isomerase [Fimbriimonadaceae bacterium]|nr:peptidylprolyl isomerase [Fimbriimonadaceae bacterium]
MQENQLPATAAPGAKLPSPQDEIVVLETTEGRIAISFFPDKAPNHVENFKKLAKEGFYDGTRFHRVIKGFMIQGGDPNSKELDKASAWGTGNPGYAVDAEFNDTKHTRGILSMARSSNPNSAGCQFFIMDQTSAHLDGQYTAFGIVVEGMDVVDKVVATPVTDRNGTVVPEKAVQITKASVTTWSKYRG